MKIILEGRIPSKKNSRIMVFKNRRRPISIPKPEYTEWVKKQSLALSNNVPKRSIDLCSITMTFFFPDKRRADLSNKCEGITDLLVDNKIIRDDDWTCVNNLHLVSGGIDREKPRVEIEIIKLKRYRR